MAWTSGIFLNYGKAFDSVPHERLVSKLKMLGISVKFQNWIRSFLTIRTMQVSVGGTLSKERPVLCGSVMGPLLFIRYVNETIDTKIWSRIENTEENSSLQEDLDSLTVWSEFWQLNFNKDMCRVMKVGHHHKTK